MTKTLATRTTLCLGLGFIVAAVGCWHNRRVSRDSGGCIGSWRSPGWTQRCSCFKEVLAAWGLDFRHHHEGSGDFYMPETMGSGVMIFDYDGLADHFYRNRGDGTTDLWRNRAFDNQRAGKLRYSPEPCGVL